MIGRALLPCLLILICAGSISAQTESAPQITLPKMQSLSITGEYRLRFEDFLNFDLNTSVHDDNDVFTQRVRLNFAAQITDNLSAFVQVQDARNWGEETSTTDASADGLDIHQGWAQLENTPGISGTLRVGRQVLAFGDERLIGGLEWLSQGRAFDGVRHTWEEEDTYTVDVFLMHIRERMVTGVAHDDAYFGGIYATRDTDENTELEAYALFLRDDETAAGGTEHRATLGVRWECRFENGLETGIEAATQFGEVDNADIPIGETFAVHAHGTLRGGEETPKWVRFEINAASGNDPKSSDNERFKNLFPTAHAHLGMMDFALWENLLHASVQFGINPGEGSKLTLSWHGFETLEETDRFAGPVGRISPMGGAASDSNSMGNEVDLLYRIDFDTAPAETWIELGYGVFLPGSGAKDVVMDDDIAHFFYVMSGVRF